MINGKRSIQWEHLLSLKPHVADRLSVCRFSSALEPVFTPSKHPVHSVVAGKVKVEPQKQKDWYPQYLLGSLCLIACEAA